MGKVGTAWRAMLSACAAAFLIGGLVVYGIYTIKAKDNSEQALQALGVIYGDMSAIVYDQWLATLIGLSTFGAVLVALCVWRMCTTFAVYRAGPSGWYLAAALLSGLLMWVATLWIVVVACGYVLWLVLGLVLDHNTDQAIDNLGGKLTQLQAVVGAVSTFIAAFNSAAGNNAVSEPLQSQLSAVVGDVQPRVRPDALGCPAACLDLAGWSWMELDSSCICNLDRLKAAQPYANDAWKEVAISLGGLLLMWIGTTWLLLGLAGSVGRAMMERSIARRHLDQQIITPKQSRTAVAAGRGGSSGAAAAGGIVIQMSGARHTSRQLSVEQQASASSADGSVFLTASQPPSRLPLMA